LQDYWDIIETYPNLQGGYIWDWVDQSLEYKDDKGKPYLAYGHDYHPDLPTDGNFLNNGLVDPYRNAHPHLSEVKKVYEPVQFNYLGNGIIEIENKNFFADFSDRTLQLKLLVDGKSSILKSGIELNVPPQSKVKMYFPEIPGMFIPESEFILEVSLIQKEENELIPIGYEIAWNQFLLNKGMHFNSSSDEGTALKIETFENDIQINNNKVELRINSTSGEIISWKHQGKEVTKHPIKPNFWRPPTDNDLGNGMDKWAKLWQDATYNYRAELVKNPQIIKEHVIYAVYYKLPNNEADLIVNYTIARNGLLKITLNYNPNKKELPNIPRLGMYMTLNKNFTDVSWYGKGPEESYWDRKTGQKLSVYSGKVEEQFHRYSRPQETGNKTDIRWVEVSTNDLNLKVFSNQLLNASVWPFNMKELDFNSDEGAESASGLVPVTTKHGADIEIGNTVQWNIDYLQMGVGGDTSWGRLVHPEYTIPANKSYSYSFTITPKIK